MPEKSIGASTGPDIYSEVALNSWNKNRHPHGVYTKAPFYDLVAKKQLSVEALNKWPASCPDGGFDRQWRTS